MFSYVSQSLPSVLGSTSNHSVHSHSSSQRVVEGIPVVPSVVEVDGVVVTGVVGVVGGVVVVETGGLVVSLVVSIGVVDSIVEILVDV